MLDKEAGKQHQLWSQLGESLQMHSAATADKFQGWRIVTLTSSPQFQKQRHFSLGGPHIYGRSQKAVGRGGGGLASTSDVLGAMLGGHSQNPLEAPAAGDSTGKKGQEVVITAEAGPCGNRKFNRSVR